jgi:hypothetical protein
MTADQDEQVVKSLNQIAYSLEYLTRYASQLCNHFKIIQPTPPNPPGVTGPSFPPGMRK